MNCGQCHAPMSIGDRFCGECGSPAVMRASPTAEREASPLAPKLRCANCGVGLAARARSCGACGLPVKREDAAPKLFPLFGVLLGQTTRAELARLGRAALTIEKETGAPYPYYEVRGTNFWYDESGVAVRIYLARNVYAMPAPWTKLGLNWKLSYDEWIDRLERWGFDVSVDDPPRTVEYSGHESFCATVRARRDSIELTLNFNYNRGGGTGAADTLYSLTVVAS